MQVLPYTSTITSSNSLVCFITRAIREMVLQDGSNALMLACGNGHLNVVTLLIGAGADVNQTDNDVSILSYDSMSEMITIQLLFLIVIRQFASFIIAISAS